MVPTRDDSSSQRSRRGFISSTLVASYNLHKKALLKALEEALYLRYAEVELQRQRNGFVVSTRT